MLEFLIRMTRKALEFLESVDMARRKRNGAICSCAKPKCAFGHRDFCFACRKSTGN